MRENLELSIPKLCAYFKVRDFEQLLAELNYYDKNVKRHFAAFQNTKKAWFKIIKQVKINRKNNEMQNNIAYV